MCTTCTTYLKLLNLSWTADLCREQNSHKLEQVTVASCVFPPNRVMSYCPLKVKWKTSPAMKWKAFVSYNTIGLCLCAIWTKQEWNCYTTPKVPTDGWCGFYLLEKTLAYSGKKLFAGPKSSLRELKKAWKYIKKGFRTEYAKRTWGKVGLRARGEESNVF